MDDRHLGRDRLTQARQADQQSVGFDEFVVLDD